MALAEKHAGRFGSLAALRDIAESSYEREEVAFLANNAMGKSMLINHLLMIMMDKDAAQTYPLLATTPSSAAAPPGRLPASAAAAAAAAAAAGDVHDSALVAALREEGVEYTVRLNPDATQNTGHIELAAAALEDYFAGSKDSVNEDPLLLPVGNLVGSTTQLQMYISHDPVVCCIIVPRSGADLGEMAAEILASIGAQVLGEGEERKLLHDEEFVRQCDLLEQLTGHSVIERNRAGESLEAIVGELEAEQAARRARGFTLVSNELAETANMLTPTVFLGTRENLSSDLHYVARTIASPMDSLLDACQVPERRRHIPRHELVEPCMVGMLIQRVDISVPCPALGPLVLVDIPGLNDQQAFAYYNTMKVLESTHHVMGVVRKNLGGEVELLRCLTKLSSWLPKQIANPASSGQLIVFAHPELAQFPLKQLWNEEMRAAADKNHSSSEAVLSRSLHLGGSQMALSALSTTERNQGADDFIARRAHFITATPATFFSLEQASSRDVYRTLGKQVKGLQSECPDPAQAHDKLKALTNMSDLTELLGRLCASQQVQRLRELKAEAQRQIQALSAEGDGKMAADQVVQLSLQLARKLSEPANIDSFLQAVQQHQGQGRRDQQSAGTVKGVSDLLMADLQEWRGLLLAEYRDELLTDDRISALAGGAISTLQDARAPELTMGHLRRLCKNKTMMVKGVPDVVNVIVASLGVSGTRALQECREQVLQPHRVAAQRLASIMHSTLGTFAPDPDLATFLRSDHLWPLQLVARVEEELMRPAQYNLAGEDPKALDEGVTHLLRTLLKQSLDRASTSVGKGVKRAEFLGVLQDALIEALRAFREQLPQRLDDIVKQHVEEEVFGKLFLSVKKKTHGMWQLEKHASGWAGPAAAAASAGQAQGLGAGAGGRTAAGEPSEAAAAKPMHQQARVRQRSKFERQACLWRAFYRFVRTAQSVVAGQEDQNASERAALVEELSVLQAGLAEAMRQHSGRSMTLAQRYWRSGHQDQASAKRPRLGLPGGLPPIAPPGAPQQA